MKKRKGWAAKMTGLALSVGLALGPAVVPQAAFAMGTSGAATVRGFYSTLMSAMRGGAQLGGQGRYALLAPVVQQDFDVPFMTRLAVGPDWASLTPVQRQQVTQAFGHYISAVYANRFDSYSGEQLVVTGEHQTAAGVIIDSQIIQSDGKPISINYLMRPSEGTWQIADVYLNGTISELATRRAEFASILSSQGINGLIQQLNSKAAALSTSSS
jgi:phospholipid transport system substrate-binding protein